jgi:hypothetical protein
MMGPDFQRPGSGILEGGRVHPGVAARIAAARGRGAALDPAVQEQAAGALGDSFADVRVHTDALAGALARSVQARAFTTGSDIFFASGEFRPQSPSGRELIAHELTHVVQQRGAPTAGAMVVSEPGDALEREAERAARSV